MSGVIWLLRWIGIVVTVLTGGYILFWWIHDMLVMPWQWQLLLGESLYGPLWRYEIAWLTGALALCAAKWLDTSEPI